MGLPSYVENWTDIKHGNIRIEELFFSATENHHVLKSLSQSIT